MFENVANKVQIGFHGTESYREHLQDQSRLRGIKSKRGRKGSVQPLLEEAVDLFLSVSPERYRLGDIARLKAYAAQLAGEKPKAQVVAMPKLSRLQELLRELERLAEERQMSDDIAFLETSIKGILKYAPNRPLKPDGQRKKIKNL